MRISTNKPVNAASFLPEILLFEFSGDNQEAEDIRFEEFEELESRINPISLSDFSELEDDFGDLE